MSGRRAELRLVLRERRATLEQSLLNRAFRAEKGMWDRVVRRAVATQVPKVAPEPGRTKTVDAPSRPSMRGSGGGSD
jgi:hypothetical protein